MVAQVNECFINSPDDGKLFDYCGALIRIDEIEASKQVKMCK
jgi:hypothetical protein